MAYPRTPNPITIVDDIAYVETTFGKTFLIDAADVPLIDHLTWMCRELYSGYFNVYAVHRKDGVRTNLLLNRFLMKAHGHDAEGMFVDHRDRDPLNNKLSNLRVVGHRTSSLNRGHFQNTSSGMRGVYPRHGGRRFVAVIGDRGTHHYGGSYRTKTEAAIAADRLQVKIRGDELVVDALNFPHRLAQYRAELCVSGSI